MRTLTLILLSLLLAPTWAEAQLRNSFSEGIFKTVNNEEPVPAKPTLSDFHLSSDDLSSSSLLDAPRNNPGIAFAASALIPGSAQAANGKWVRAGIYFTAELVGVIYHLNLNAKAKRQEKAYEQYTHEYWSVLAYSEWLVNYSQMHNLNNGWQNLQAHIEGKTPDFGNTVNDWAKVNINLLHSVESQTPYYFKDRIGSNFSHTLPEYGSQQYYELISKYYQFQPGWQDWYGTITTSPTQTLEMYRYFWNGSDQPFDMFYEGRDRAQEFNDNYRVAGNIVKLLLVNHIVSAFDALFTVQLKNSRIETQTRLLNTEQFSVSWHF